MNELEQYRTEFKKRHSLALIFVIAGLALSFFGNLILRANIPDAPIVNIITAAGIVFELICVGYMSFNLSKMRNDSTLRQAYIRETDGRPIVTVLSMTLVGASFIVGAFSIPAFIALQCAAAFQLIVAFVLTGYWSRKL